MCREDASFKIADYVGEKDELSRLLFLVLNTLPEL